MPHARYERPGRHCAGRAGEGVEEDRAGRLDSVDPTSPQFFNILKRYTSKAVNDEATDYMYFTGGYVYDRGTVVHILDDLLWGEAGTIDDAEKRVDVKASYDRMGESYRLAIYKQTLIHN